MTAPPPPPPSQFRPLSSEWWIERLTIALHNRLDRYKKLERYYNGTQNLATLAGASWRESEVSKMFPKFLHANHSRLVVNAAAQRLVIQGFRFTSQIRADVEAARIWRANSMDTESAKAHIEAMVKGECPVLVEPNPRDARTPVITAQDPSQVIVWHAPGDRRIRLAALKTWYDLDVRKRYYILYLPDAIERWQDREPSQMDAWMGRLFGARTPRWEIVSRETNPLGEVPVVVLPNDPRLTGKPEAEHEPVLTQIDHYNKTLMDMAVTSHELAYPQRWASGIEPEPEEEEALVETIDGEPVAVEAVGTPRPAAQTGQTRWVTSPIPDAQFGQFVAAQLDNYVKELAQIRADIATDTFTPYHFLLNMPSSVPPSGESITASEAPLVDKVRQHGRDKGSAWRQIMRLAFLVANDVERANAMRDSGQTIWEDPERRTESQHIDALSKLAAPPINVPQLAIWERIPIAPDEIDRWLRMLEEQSPSREVTTPSASADGPEPSDGLTAAPQGGQ